MASIFHSVSQSCVVMGILTSANSTALRVGAWMIQRPASQSMASGILIAPNETEWPKAATSPGPSTCILAGGRRPYDSLYNSASPRSAATRPAALCFAAPCFAATDHSLRSHRRTVTPSVLQSIPAPCLQDAATALSGHSGPGRHRFQSRPRAGEEIHPGIRQRRRGALRLQPGQGSWTSSW